MPSRNSSVKLVSFIIVILSKGIPEIEGTKLEASAPSLQFSKSNQINFIKLDDFFFNNFKNSFNSEDVASSTVMCVTLFLFFFKESNVAGTPFFSEFKVIVSFIKITST